MVDAKHMTTYKATDHEVGKAAEYHFLVTCSLTTIEHTTVQQLRTQISLII